MPELSFSKGTLVLDGADAQWLRVHSPDVPWKWDHRSKQWRTDAMHYPSVVKLFASSGPSTEESQLVDRVPRWQSIENHQPSLVALRDEQRAAVTAWEERRSGYVVMATGTGKTEVAIEIMARQATSTLVVAPVRDLMYQWHRRIQQRLGYDSGLVGDQRKHIKPLTVTTYDSACIYMEQLGDQFELIIFDECHHLPGPMRREAAIMSAAPMRLGLTATPERKDGNENLLDQLIGPSVFQLGIRQAAGRQLADYQVIRIPVELNDRERESYASCSRTVQEYVAQRRRADAGFRWEQVFRESLRDPVARKAVEAFRLKKTIEERADEKFRVLEDLFRLHVDEPVIIFTGSNEMAREVSRRFLIPCLLSHCGKVERADILDGLATGGYPAVVANQVLDEGVDLPEVNVAIIVGGSGSERQAKQRLGRILRKNRFGSATLYEVVSVETSEVQRSRDRRRNDAFQRTDDR